MIQISNKIYCDDMFSNITLENKLLPNPYKDYPYLIVEDFLSKSLCKDIVDDIKSNNEYIKAQVKDQILNGIVKSKLNEKYRKTNILKLSDKYESIYKKQFLNLQPKIEEYFHAPITFSSTIQMLEYKRGSFYTKHADDSSEILDKDKNTIGFKNVAPYRKITTVLFCSQFEDKTDDYSFNGGELVFNYLYDENQNQIKIKPKIGDLIIFPSNPYFSHEVLPVKSGYRLTLVQWHDAILQ